MEQEQFVATLVNTDEYKYQINRVTGLTSQRIQFLKRKFASRVGGEVITIPIEQCVFIAYRDKRPLHIIVLGVLLSLATWGPIIYLAMYWSSISLGMHVRVGLLLMGGLIGLRMTFGARRHELIFALKGRRDVKWKSRPGDFKYKQSAVDKVVEFAREKGVLRRRSR